MAKTLLVDGNYLFFLCRSMGVQQDFAKLEQNILKTLGFDGVDRKVFYTRPPKHDSAKSVLTWLRSHGWETHLYRYEQVSQDVLYNAMAVELLDAAYTESDAEVVIVSGSGALLPALNKLKTKPSVRVTLVCTDESTSEIIKGMGHVSRIDLARVMGAF